MSAADDISIRHVQHKDRAKWLTMRRTLYMTSGQDEVDQFLSGNGFAGFENSVVLVAETRNGELVGFAEATTRSYAEGCKTTPVAYLEGWYVSENRRSSGIGALLVSAAENWARRLGIKEIASDAAPDNHVSRAAHAALGFEEKDHMICFAKTL